MSQYALSWDAYKKNICSGLSALQQNGEFVDMTIAADGHLVKVHQVIMALASPYIKELISSAKCSHPVIFLNKVSYQTLCALLEYVYTGEVLVSLDTMNNLVEAGRELHIKGLEDVNVNGNESLPILKGDPDVTEDLKSWTDDDSKDVQDSELDRIRQQNESMEYCEYESNVSGTLDYHDKSSGNTNSKKASKTKNLTPMQYTVSNQGSLQMILNRYLYYLKYTNLNGTRQWRCVDYINNLKCPAYVVTKNNVVLQRTSAHIHPFHDKKILKKVQAGSVFCAMNDAEEECKVKKLKHEQDSKEVEVLE